MHRAVQKVVDLRSAARPLVQIEGWDWRGGDESASRIAESKRPGVLIVDAGTITIDVGGTSWLLDPTRALTLHDNTARVHITDVGCAARWTLMSLALDATSEGRVDGALSHAGARDASMAQLSSAALIRYRWIKRAVTQRTADDRSIESAAAAFVRELAKLPPDARAVARRRRSHRRLTDRAQAMLAGTVGAPHRLTDIARTLGTSPFHLAHVFHDEIGSSLHQYLVRLRLIAALDRLSEGENNLSRLAVELGFSHHSHFSAAFRKRFGQSPREVRLLLRSDDAFVIAAPALATAG